MQVPRRPAPVGQAAARTLRRHRRQGVDFPLRRRLRRLVAHRGAALQQRHARRDRDMAAVLGGAQSIFTCRLRRSVPDSDRVLRPNSRCARSRSSRYESGIAATVDPLGGSHLRRMAHRPHGAGDARRVMGEIDAYGGVVKAIEEGWLQRRIAERAHERKKNVDRTGEPSSSGQNPFRSGEGAQTAMARCSGWIRPHRSACSEKFDAELQRTPRQRARVERELARLTQRPRRGSRESRCPILSIAATPMRPSARWSGG